MTDKQSNHVDSINNVYKVYTDHLGTIGTKAAVDAEFSKLGNLKQLISTAIGGQSGSTTGSTVTKKQIREDLNSYSFGLMAPVKGWAVTQNDNTLVADMDHSETDLGKIKDDTFADFIKLRRDNVVNNLVNLGGLGIVQADIDLWDQKIAAFEAVTTDPRQAIINRSLHTDNLAIHIPAAMQLMDEVLDGMMVLFKNSDPELYAKYVKSREIIDLKGPGDGTPDGVNAIINIVFTNAADLTPIVGAGVSLNGEAEVFTDAEGKVQFTKAPGVYAADVTADGFANASFSLDVVTPGVYNFTFQLTPSV